MKVGEEDNSNDIAFLLEPPMLFKAAQIKPKSFEWRPNSFCTRGGRA